MKLNISFLMWGKGIKIKGILLINRNNTVFYSVVVTLIEK